MKQGDVTNSVSDPGPGQVQGGEVEGAGGEDEGVRQSAEDDAGVYCSF